MPHAKSEVYLHFVWATKGRQSEIHEAIERTVYRCIEAEAKRLGCQVYAVGGLPDHVHLLVQKPPKIAESNLIKMVKGNSSALINDLRNQTGGFRWQEGYGLFSISRSHVERVIAYIENQKTRHANGKLWPEWEATDGESEN